MLFALAMPHALATLCLFFIAAVPPGEVAPKLFISVLGPAPFIVWARPCRRPLAEKELFLSLRASGRVRRARSASRVAFVLGLILAVFLFCFVYFPTRQHPTGHRTFSAARPAFVYEYLRKKSREV